MDYDFLCPMCGETLYPDQAWRLQPDLEPGKPETEYDERNVVSHGYLHKGCAEAVAYELPRKEVWMD